MLELGWIQLKMHLDFISRGSKRDIDRFIDEIQAKYLPIDFKGQMGACNIVYRPIQMGELIFPEPMLQTVLQTLKPLVWKREDPILKMFKLLLGKTLKLGKIPKIDDKIKPLPVWNHNIELQLLGIKKDVFADGYERL